LLLEPGEGVAVAGAAEAVVAPAIGVDLERRRLLRVERAETLVEPTGLLERDPLADQLNDVDALFDEIEVTRHQSQYRAGLAL